MPQVAEAQPELVAHHWGEAGEVETAIEWWIRAGERASERAVCDEGVACGRRGLALLEGLPEGDARRKQELRLQMLMGGVLRAKFGYAHSDAIAAWERARSLSQVESDLMGAALVRYNLCSGHVSRGNYSEGLRLAAEVREMQQHLRHPVIEVASYYIRGVVLLYQGQLSDSLTVLGAACRLSEADSRYLQPIGIDRPGLIPWGYRAWALWAAGFADQSRTSAQRGQGYAHAFGNPYGVCYLTAWSAVAAFLRREWSEARKLGLEASRLGSEQGFSLPAAVAAFAEAAATVKCDRDVAALERYARAIEAAGPTGNRAMATVILGNYADLLLTLDRRSEASRYLDGALALSREMNERFYLAELQRLYGEIALRTEGQGEEEAETLFREAIETARGQLAKSLELRAATSLARLWRNQGRRAEARELLAPIYAWFTKGFDTLDLIEAKALLEELGA